MQKHQSFHPHHYLLHPPPPHHFFRQISPPIYDGVHPHLFLLRQMLIVSLMVMVCHYHGCYYDCSYYKYGIGLSRLIHSSSATTRLPPIERALKTDILSILAADQH